MMDDANGLDLFKPYSDPRIQKSGVYSETGRMGTYQRAVVEKVRGCKAMS